MLLRAVRGLDATSPTVFLKCYCLLLYTGQKAASALTKHTKLDISKMPFMSGAEADVAGIKCRVTRCGYTGEDGFEVLGDLVEGGNNLRNGPMCLRRRKCNFLRRCVCEFISRAEANCGKGLSHMKESNATQISIPADKCVHVCEALLQDPAVQLAGLGARDSLRLEAGLCLYGYAWFGRGHARY